MSAVEIAECLGLNINTVYTRLRVARRAFDAAHSRYRARAVRAAHIAYAEEGSVDDDEALFSTARAAAAPTEEDRRRVRTLLRRRLGRSSRSDRRISTTTKAAAVLTWGFRPCECRCLRRSSPRRFPRSPF